MTLKISGDDYTDRLVEQGAKVSQSLSESFGQIAKQKTYALRDYDNFFNPFSPAGLFALINYRGLEVVETDARGLVVFRGTIQAVQQTDDSLCVITCTEPLGLFLDWPVEATDQTTYAGFTVNGAVAQGVAVIPVETGTGLIPDGAVVWFGQSKVPSYVATTTDSTGGNTTEITLDRPLEVALADGDALTVSVPDTTTGPAALKAAIQTAAPDVLLDGTFDILAASDAAAGAEIIINVREQDDIKLRDYVRQICEMCRLELFQKNDGYYTCRRGIEYAGASLTESLSGDEICGPVEITFDDSRLVVGYDLIYKRSANEAAILSADVDSELVRKHNGIKYWKPVPTAATFAALKYMYASEGSARFFGDAHLDFFCEPLITVNCTAKRAYNSDPNQALDLYVGKELSLSLRDFVDEPAIITALEYDNDSMAYSSLTFVINGRRYRAGALVSSSVLITDGGEAIVNESFSEIEVW
jgi:hypothetical protein